MFIEFQIKKIYLFEFYLNFSLQQLVKFMLFQSSFTENHDVYVYNILTSRLTVTFSRLELWENILYILWIYNQAINWDLL